MQRKKNTGDKTPARVNGTAYDMVLGNLIKQSRGNIIIIFCTLSPPSTPYRNLFAHPHGFYRPGIWLNAKKTGVHHFSALNALIGYEKVNYYITISIIVCTIPTAIVFSCF